MELILKSYEANYSKASKLISRAAHGNVRSNFVITSGCSTPSLPIVLPYIITSAHLPGKNDGSMKINPLKICMSPHLQYFESKSHCCLAGQLCDLRLCFYRNGKLPRFAEM